MCCRHLQLRLQEQMSKQQNATYTRVRVHFTFFTSITYEHETWQKIKHMHESQAKNQKENNNNNNETNKYRRKPVNCISCGMNKWTNCNFNLNLQFSLLTYFTNRYFALTHVQDFKCMHAQAKGIFRNSVSERKNN